MSMLRVFMIHVLRFLVAGSGRLMGACVIRALVLFLVGMMRLLMLCLCPKPNRLCMCKLMLKLIIKLSLFPLFMLITTILIGVCCGMSLRFMVDLCVINRGFCLVNSLRKLNYS